MNPQQLRETTMDPASRSLIKITLPSAYEERQAARDIVEQLMGKDPSLRFAYIKSHANAVEDDAIDA